MTQAIFLSYASQDADAARRICDALRAAGLEVWFDQNELRGGDAWDQKIRRQIKECALFVPIISANTEERLEGYFRLEWRLADQRTHLMATGKPFLMPIVIDDTRDAGAHVPDSFLDVQWTRIPRGDGGESFAQRVVALLEPSSPLPPLAPANALPRPAAPSSRVSRRRPISIKFLAVAGVALAIAATLLFVQPWKTTSTTQLAAGSNKTSPEIKQLVVQVEDLIRDPMTATRESYFLADELMKRVLSADQSDADHWVRAARVSLMLYQQVYDRSDQRVRTINEQVENAIRLSPESIAVKAVQAYQKYLADDLVESLRLCREILSRAPNDRTALSLSARIARSEKRDADAEAFLERSQKLHGGDPMGLMFDGLSLGRSGRLREAETRLDQVVAMSPTRMAYNAKIEFLKNYLADPAAAVNFAAQIPARLLTEEAIGGHVAEAYILTGRGEEAIAVLKQIPRDYLSEFAINVPKGTLVGAAHELSERKAAASAEWRDALALVEKRLSTDPKSLALLRHKALLQAMLGQKSAALETLRLRIELGAESSPLATAPRVQILVRAGKKAEAIDVIEKNWKTSTVPQKSQLVRDLAFLPEHAELRKDPRIVPLISEQLAFISAGRAAPSATSAAATK